MAVSNFASSGTAVPVWAAAGSRGSAARARIRFSIAQKVFIPGRRDYLCLEPMEMLKRLPMAMVWARLPMGMAILLLALFGEGGKVDLSRVRPEFHNDVNFWLKTWRLFSPKGQGGGEADMISDEMARNMVIAVGQHELTLRRKRGGQQRDRAQGVDPLLKEDTPQQPPRPWEKQKPRRRFGVLQADE